jgi:glycosyltransferase involved in cell wall biosynthesis
VEARLTAIILTYNEEKHIARCLESIRDVVDNIIVVDCFSTDSTVSIARELGAKIIQRKWKNYADQFNWAIKQLSSKETDWILRIDSDEILTAKLKIEICEKLDSLPLSVDGVFCGRKMRFLGSDIRYGGLFPIRVLRIFRLGRGQCENRWMDEHIKVEGKTSYFNSEIIDDNLNTVTWWTDKHNKYASREAVDMLNLEFNFLPYDSVASLSNVQEASVKRWVKERLYSRLPLGLRSFLYFFYRYFIRLGFLEDGSSSSFHFLQGLWYRYLIDVKVAEVKYYMRCNNSSVVDAINEVLNIDLR